MAAAASRRCRAPAAWACSRLPCPAFGWATCPGVGLGGLGAERRRCGGGGGCAGRPSIWSIWAWMDSDICSSALRIRCIVGCAVRRGVGGACEVRRAGTFSRLETGAPCCRACWEDDSRRGGVAVRVDVCCCRGRAVGMTGGTPDCARRCAGRASRIGPAESPYSWRRVASGMSSIDVLGSSRRFCAALFSCMRRTQPSTPITTRTTA